MIMDALMCTGSMADKSESGKKDPPYPGESPTAPEHEHWRKAFENNLLGTDYEQLLRGDVPTSLIGLAASVDLTDMVEQLAPTGAESQVETRQRTQWNLRVRVALRDERARAQAYEAGLLKLKSALAGKVTSMLTDGHALGLLSSLKTKYVIGNPDADRPQYDGYRMALALFERGKVKDGPTAQRDGEWYEAEFQRVKAQVLNDHCTVQEFSDKVVHLREELIPNFRTITLKGEMLSEVIVKLMPLCNASEGRTLQREMTKAKTWNDCEAVLRECVAIISGDADAQVEDARRSAAIMPAGAARVAAIAAAASMVPGGGPPPPSGRPPGGGVGGAIVPSSAEVAAATKRATQEAAKTALAAAVKRAEKETKRQRGLLPTGQWCKQKTCRFPHTDHCTSDPDWVGPLSTEVEADAAHVSRIEGRRIACAKRLHSEGKRSSPVPKPLKKRAAARPGGAATLVPTGPDDDDDMGDGMGRLAFQGEPGFDVAPGCPVLPTDTCATRASVVQDCITMCQEVDDEEDDHDGEWYLLENVLGLEDGQKFARYLVHTAEEMSALRTLATSREGTALTNFGPGLAGADRLEQALVSQLRVTPAESVPRIAPTEAMRASAAAGAADAVADAMMALGDDLASPMAHRQLISDAMRGTARVRDELEAARLAQEAIFEQQRAEIQTRVVEFEAIAARSAAINATNAAQAAVPPTTESRLYPPTSKFYAVLGGPFEGVHQIFDEHSELDPLISMPGASAYGASHGVVTRSDAEAKLGALQRARAAQQWRDTDGSVEGATAAVVQGLPETLSYPAARAAIAELNPTSPIRDIRNVCTAAGLPVSTAVGGKAPSTTSPGRGRNRADILADARRVLGMTVPPEWSDDVQIEATEHGEENGDPAQMRRGAVSPLTLIKETPILTEQQMAGIAMTGCILFATIALVLATGVPVAPLCYAIVTFVGRISGAASGLRMVTGTPTDAAALVVHSDLDWARSVSSGAIFTAFMALTTMVALTLHILSEFGMLRLATAMLRRLNAAHARACLNLGRTMRRLPVLLRVLTAAIGTGTIGCLMFLLVRGTDGQITEGKVARARSVMVDMPMPASMRAIAQEIALDKHSLAFQSASGFLERNDTVKLAGALGIPVYLNLIGSKSSELDESRPASAFEISQARAPRLTLLDTGAAVDTSDGTLERDGGYAVEGTRGANIIAVSTANGTIVPPEHIENRIPCRRRNGSLGMLVRPRALIMDNCPHTLVSTGTLAATDGYGFWLGPYASESYLRPTQDPADDIPFINVGVAILPDAGTPCMPSVARGQRGAAKFDAETVHRTFNGRSADVLKHLPECTPDAPAAWRDIPSGACDPCEMAKAKRVPLTGSAGQLSDANATVAIDDWEVSVGHIHGGQRIVGGYHHNGSGVNRFYLKKTKSGAETAKYTNLYFTWMRNVCMWAVTHLHGDNAPNLIMGENKAMCDDWGVHVTSCAPYEPRGNSTIERPWRTFGEDVRSALSHANLTSCESLWWYAGRDANQKDWCIPIRSKKGKEVNGRKWTTKWELLTGHRPRVTQHYPFGCLCYMLTYHPDSKVAQRGVRCLNFGRAEGQPGYLCFDGSKIWVTPHCSMVPGCFPGLTRRAGGGLMVPEPKLGTNFSEIPPDDGVPPGDENDETPTNIRKGSHGSHGSGDGGVARVEDEGLDAEPPHIDLADDDDDDDDDDGDDGDGVERISQRLQRRNRGVRTTAQGSSDGVPGAPAGVTFGAPSNPSSPRGPWSGWTPTPEPKPPDTPKPKGNPSPSNPKPGNKKAAPPPSSAPASGRAIEACRRFNMDVELCSEAGREFVIYVGSGRDRPGSVREHAAKHNLTVVMIDKKVGGYEHDLAYAPVAAAIDTLLRLPNCHGIFASLPCGTWSVLRYVRPGPPVLRRIASAINGWRDEVLGIKRVDGSLPDSVINANLMVENLAAVAETALELGKLFAYESPVSRAEASQFAVKGREDHAEMSTHPALASLIERHGLVRIAFDQCMTGSSFEKKTQIIADKRAAVKVRAKFGTRVCDGSHEHSSMVGDVNENGTFMSEDASAYSSEMNELIAEVYVETIRVPRQLANVAAPMGDWSSWMRDTPLMAVSEEVTDEDFRRAYAPDPHQQAKAAFNAAPTAWRETMQWSGIDGQAFPLQAEEFAGDSPSYNHSIVGPDKREWAEARRSEMANLHNHDAYLEIAEDSLPTWDEKRGTASEVVNTLWVNVKKRNEENVVKKFKSRCVYDGRQQKVKAAAAGKELYSYAPCGRPSTHKCQIASAVHHKRRHRTFDVTGAYLKGKFTDNEVVYARPPPGERTYTFRNGRKTAIVWKLQVPLYGEVDAGYIWNRTATQQLVGVQKWNQSEHDPGYFWKKLDDGTFMDLLLYVDDAYVTDSHSPLADLEIETFGMAFADKDGSSGITVQEPSHFLGANIDVESPESVTISSKAYTRQMAAKYLPKPLEDYPMYHTPCAKDLVEAYDEARDRVGTLDTAGQAEYASKCGAGIFAGPCSRFDALYTLGMCSRCLTFPTERMMKAIERCIVYMAQTCDRGINFNNQTSIVYEAYSDADWQVAHSTTGTCHCIGGRVVHASSKRQQSISISTTEAEIMAASLAATEIVFMRNLLTEMGYDMSEPTVLWVDNMGAVEITKRRESLARSRHIERRYLKMQEWVAEGKIQVKYINTDENRADMFTKPLDRATFEKHASGIMGWLPSTPKVANTIWVSAVKRSEQNVEKFKARCVYGGRQQE